MAAAVCLNLLSKRIRFFGAASPQKPRAMALAQAALQREVARRVTRWRQTRSELPGWAQSPPRYLAITPPLHVLNQVLRPGWDEINYPQVKRLGFKGGSELLVRRN